MKYTTPLFSVVSSLPAKSARKAGHVYLLTDNWDDWAKYRTQFSVFVIDAEGEEHSLGSVKIGEVALKPRGR